MSPSCTSGSPLSMPFEAWREDEAAAAAAVAATTVADFPLTAFLLLAEGMASAEGTASVTAALAKAAAAAVRFRVVEGISKVVV